MLKTSCEWYDEIYPNKELKILDPDGWDRGNLFYSWYEEKITLEEFNRRLAASTVKSSDRSEDSRTGDSML